MNSDVIAAQTLQACGRLHIPVPERLKIIGFDDVFLSTLTTPQLTTIHQPAKEMAEIAVNLLHDSFRFYGPLSPNPRNFGPSAACGTTVSRPPERPGKPLSPAPHIDFGLRETGGVSITIFNSKSEVQSQFEAMAEEYSKTKGVELLSGDGLDGLRVVDDASGLHAYREAYHLAAYGDGVIRVGHP